MAYPSLAPFILKRPWLRSFFTPVANWYVNAAGYRQLGLRYVYPLSLAPNEANGYNSPIRGCQLWTGSNTGTFGTVIDDLDTEPMT
jgi:hypothetical protein